MKTVLSERLVSVMILDLKRDIAGLKGFVALGNELERDKEYRAWLKELEAYYAENCTPPTVEELNHRRQLEVLKQLEKLGKF